MSVHHSIPTSGGREPFSEIAPNETQTPRYISMGGDGGDYYLDADDRLEPLLERLCIQGADATVWKGDKVVALVVGRRALLVLPGGNVVRRLKPTGVKS